MKMKVEIVTDRFPKGVKCGFCGALAKPSEMVIYGSYKFNGKAHVTLLHTFHLPEMQQMADERADGWREEFSLDLKEMLSVRGPETCSTGQGI